MTTAVLIVDDDALFRGLARRMLVGMGFTVVGEAATVTAAATAAKELRPDAALVDINLPDGDGFVLASMLAALTRPPRVVLTSTDRDAGTPDGIRGCGAVGFVAKDDLPDHSLRELLAGP